MNNIKNTWKGIKSIIAIKNRSSDIPKSLSYNGSTITNKVEILNIFKNFLQQLLKKQKEISMPHTNISLIS